MILNELVKSLMTLQYISEAKRIADKYSFIGKGLGNRSRLLRSPVL
jgi:hypothetical protein